MCRVKFNNSFTVDFCFLNHVISGNEMDHLCSKFFCKCFDQFFFVITFSTVTNQSSKTHYTSFCKFGDTFTKIVSGIHGHHFT